MQPITFDASGTPRNMLGKTIGVFLVLIIVILWGAKDSLGSSIGAYAIVFVGAAILFSAGWLLFYKKIYEAFSLDDRGISVGGEVVPWSDIRDFHALGTSLDEVVDSRHGATSPQTLDPINLYGDRNIFVLRIKHSLLPREKRLRVLAGQVDQFLGMLSAHGISPDARRPAGRGLSRQSVIGFTILILGILFVMCIPFFYQFFS
jgi:hypothetical protein